MFKQFYLKLRAIWNARNEYKKGTILDRPMLQDPQWGPLPLLGHKPPRRIDIDLFRKVKRALALKKDKKFYSTNRQVAKKFNLTPTTIKLIARSHSLKHYRELRTKESNNGRRLY